MADAGYERVTTLFDDMRTNAAVAGIYTTIWQREERMYGTASLRGLAA
jgi:hypothetical protein